MIDVLNVGHGGCTVLRSAGQYLVIDVCNLDPLLELLYGDSLFGNVIHAVVITHLDRDHCKGLLRLLGSDIGVERLVINPDFVGWATERGSTRRRHAMGKSGASIAKRSRSHFGVGSEIGIEPGEVDLNLAATLAARIEFECRRKGAGWHANGYLGQAIVVGEYQVEVLWPPSAGVLRPEVADLILGRRVVDRNQLSMALRVDARSSRGMVVGGDCTAGAVRVSREDYGMTWECDVLLFPHHGGVVDDVKSNETAARAIRDATQPKVLLFQIGCSRKFPREEVVAAFLEQKGGVRVACTGLSEACTHGTGVDEVICAGNVRVELGEKWVIRTERVGHQRFVSRVLGEKALCDPGRRTIDEK